jgi:LuxR family transcriptional regulator, quorum-sensing system regulator BjaR1
VSDRFEQTVRYVDAVERAQTAREVEECLLAFAAGFGFTAVFGGIVPLRPVPLTEIPSRIVFQHVPDGWADRYNRRGYVFRDPIVARLLTERVPFTWTDAYRTCPDRESVKIVGGEASDFGLREGYVVPISTIEGDLAAVSFGGPLQAIEPTELGALNFAASYAVGSYFRHAAARRRLSAALTPRECDCLLWAGEGKTDWEISVILGISRSTVIKHIAAAREKLGAVNKAHAIAKAIRIKLLA